MKFWHAVFIAFMLCVSAVVAWENLSGYYRLMMVLALILWVLFVLAAFLLQVFTAERAYRPYPLGTRFQRKMFWRTVALGPLMFLFLDPVFKGKPLIKLPD